MKGNISIEGLDNNFEVIFEPGCASIMKFNFIVPSISNDAVLFLIVEELK